jgi:hypothetical protein
LRDDQSQTLQDTLSLRQCAWQNAPRCREHCRPSCANAPINPSYIFAACCGCRTSFKDVGKGWYNLSESNFETYRFSKLRRFLGLVRFGMEDSLRYLAEGSMGKFVAFMQVGGMRQA